MEKKKKVVIGMSGGVDSSVAAYLLKEQGYDVIGVTMQIWQEDKDYTEREGGCCSLSAVDDARRVANKIGIPFYVMNFRDSFKEKVIDYFVQEYIDGKTPNPCIACNKHLKFDELLRKAQGIGADYVVRPEKEMWEKVARTLLRKNIKDLIELDEENCIVEMKVPQAWVGKTLSQLDLRKLYSINVLGKRNPHTHKLEVSVDPNLEIELNDTFLVLAQTDKIEKYDYLL